MFGSIVKYNYDGYSDWGIGAADGLGIYAQGGCLVSSTGNEEFECSGVRPVVSLKSNIKLKANGTRDNCTLYDLSEK